jgi:hypothetical protein
MIESHQYLRVSQSIQLVDIIRDYRPQRHSPDMWTELIAGALGMLVVLGLMYLALSYA